MVCSFLPTNSLHFYSQLVLLFLLFFSLLAAFSTSRSLSHRETLLPAISETAREEEKKQPHELAYVLRKNITYSRLSFPLSLSVPLSYISLPLLIRVLSPATQTHITWTTVHCSGERVFSICLVNWQRDNHSSLVSYQRLHLTLSFSFFSSLSCVQIEFDALALTHLHTSRERHRVKRVNTLDS